ncbi:MAG TPA: 4-(cytidine 5'-diphospho)-2-C-methyl-D-erythritol kinase [Gemmatimonadaceae bacterium]|jgi:4-diphosphocytidyl-2-C-methyl-D-erythritol kinase|nr:4-(cytidine 5'-diphospho)-2-C-methyl-D-erythritol kinase [Gemmatimonadaceae bacterium]
MATPAPTPTDGPARAGRTSAQAKVNLLLRVLGREASGYHQIETVFQRLDLADDVTVRTGVDGRSIVCTGDVIPDAGLGPPEQNLAYRAAVAYQQATGWPGGFAIEVTKRIPVGGGLGGGSADAGAVLRILEMLAPRPMGIRVLELAARLGADVPFMATETPVAWAWGRGERMLGLVPLPRRRVQLLVPSFGVSTADAYRWLTESRAPYEPVGSLLPAAALSSWNEVEEVAGNEFEGVVEARHPEIAAWRRALEKAGARIALLAGSGSTVFGVYDEGARALSAGEVEGARLVETRTAAHVVPVRPID